MKYNIADLIFDIDSVGYSEWGKNFIPFKTNAESSDLKIRVSEQDIAEFKNKYKRNFQPEYIRHMIIYHTICNWLPTANAILMHAAAIDVAGSGIVFAARGGTGKTTHMLLWKKLFPEKVTVINGDKPIVRFLSGVPNIPYIYGDPWNGKENFGCNKHTPLRHICMIERAPENSVEVLQTLEAVDLMLTQVFMPSSDNISRALSVVNRIVHSCKIWKIRCNTDPEAAVTAYNALFSGVL